MNRCSDNISGSPSFTISTRKVATGYEAKCDSIPALPAQTAAEEIDAIRAVQRAVEAHVVSGGQR
jgi:hypothetical protein